MNLIKQYLPALIVSMIAIAIVTRVSFVRKIVTGA